MASRSFATQRSKKPHLLRAGGVAAEVNDLRRDIDSGFSLIENDIDMPNGSPIYYASRYGAVGNGAADDTAALTACFNAANAVPGPIVLGRNHRVTATLPPITNNNITILGRGPFNGGTMIVNDSLSAIDVIRFNNCQYSGIKGVWIVGNRVFSAGWGIRFTSCFRPFMEDVLVSRQCFGVEHFKCTLSRVRRGYLDDLYGVFGFFARGDNTAHNHSVTYEDCVAGTAFPLSPVGNGRTWGTNTAYVVGNVVFANNSLWQCATAGTSAGSGTGPSGFPSTDPLLLHSTLVQDGTAQWRYCMPLGTWYLQGSYSHTFEVIDCGALQGGYGVGMEDTAPGAGSTPQFMRTQNVQIDHPFARGVRMLAGTHARHQQLFVTSVMEGTGVEIGGSFSGNWEFEGGEIFGCNRAGMTIAASHGLVHGMQMGAIGGVSANTRDCIEVSNSASHWTVANCSLGSMFGSTSPTSRYGLSVAAGSDNYIINGNRAIGNQTSGFLNTPGTAATRVVANNIGAVV